MGKVADQEPEHTKLDKVALLSLQTAPSNAEAWMQLGSCRFQLEQFGPAVPALRRAVHLLSAPAQNPTASMLQDSLWLLIQVTSSCRSLLCHCVALSVCACAEPSRLSCISCSFYALCVASVALAFDEFGDYNRKAVLAYSLGDCVRTFQDLLQQSHAL